MAAAHSAAAAITLVNAIGLSSASLDVLVERLAVGTNRQCLARAANRLAIARGAAIVPSPGTGGHLPVLLCHFPRRLQRLGVLNHPDGLEHHVVHLAQTRRDAGRVAQDKACAIDDDIVVTRFLEATGFKHERVALPMSDRRAG